MVKFLDLVVVDAYVDLIVASFESFAYLCVLIGAQDRSEKLLLPALVIFPINCIIKFIFIVTIFSFGALGTYNAIGIRLFLLNILHAFIYVPKWIAIYSLRQELLGNDGNGMNLIRKRWTQFKSFVTCCKHNCVALMIALDYAHF